MIKMGRRRAYRIAAIVRDAANKYDGYGDRAVMPEVAANFRAEAARQRDFADRLEDGRTRLPYVPPAWWRWLRYRFRKVR